MGGGAEVKTCLDLFSGIGGFALACRWLGIETIGFSEIDPYDCKSLSKNFPGVPNLGDIKRYAEWPDLHPDLITGGPPCQPASLAGKRRGAADDRWLWPEALRCVEKFKPTACLFENPDDLLTLNNGLEIEHVLSELESFGYEVAPPFIIPACAVNAGHERMRIWIVAHLNGGRELQQQRCQRDERGRVGDRTQQTVANTGGHGTETPACMPDNGSSVERDVDPDAQTIAADSDQCRRPGWREGNGCLGESKTGKRGRVLESPGLLRIEAPETDFSLLREVHGLSRKLDPHRRDRILCLGNSIVPQVAFQILKAMIEAEQTA